MSSTNTFYLLASTVHDLERLVKQLPNASVYSYYADFSHALKDIAFNLSKYPRDHFDRVCWVVPPVTADEKNEVKTNYLNDVSKLPEPFFRFLLDAVSVHMKDRGIVDIIESFDADTLDTASSLQLIINEWKPLAKTNFASQYGWEFERKKEVVPPVVITSQTKHVTKIVWRADSQDGNYGEWIATDAEVDEHTTEVESRDASACVDTHAEEGASDASTSAEPQKDEYSIKRRRGKFHKVKRGNSAKLDASREYEDSYKNCA